MKIKLAAAAVLLAYTLGSAPFLSAEDRFGEATLPADSPPAPAVLTISGMVQNIDPVNETVQVTDSKGMLQTIKIDEDTKVLMDGNPSTIHDLTIGRSATFKIPLENN